MPSQLAWYILLLPFFSFAIISLILRPFFKNQPKVAGYVTIAAIAGSLALSVWALLTVLGAKDHQMVIPDIRWLTIGKLHIDVGIIMDPLTVVMLMVVNVVSLMVQIYSQGYMAGDTGYHRYFASMSMFTTAMLGLVLMNSLVMVFFFWELVGLCSYLLIGFWFHRPSAAAAAKKAFIVTRIGDFGFLAAILVLYNTSSTFNIPELNHLAETGVLAGAALTWSAIGIFAGAAGKSAQFPLHVWLPDAMEGPTPVSALIHAATMVAAGVFLVARMYPLIHASATAILVVAIIGAFTAIFAATMGLVMHDIKRVIAYSTISQLGYMMLGLATGGVAVGIFHLFNHAYFKALLFLGAGSVNHATGTFDMRLMGGLRKVMPWTFATFVVAAISLAGVWPLAGFWSKDEILAKTLESQPILFVLAIVTVFMTAFYIFRVIFVTFGGTYRGGAPEAHGDEHHRHPPHESAAVMVVPLVILAVPAVISGLLNVTGGFSQFLDGEGETTSFISGFFHAFTHPGLPLISLVVALGGIFFAYAVYYRKWITAERLGKTFPFFYMMFSRKYWMDELYERVITVKVLLNGLFAAFQKIDVSGVDGIVNGIGTGIISGGKALRRAQTGQLQLYALFFVIGVLLIAASLLFIR